MYTHVHAVFCRYTHLHSWKYVDENWGGTHKSRVRYIHMLYVYCENGSRELLTDELSCHQVILERLVSSPSIVIQCLI